MSRAVQFVNKSEWSISLRDDTCKVILRELKPGESVYKDREKLLRRAYFCRSLQWRIDVLRDGRFVNIEFYPFHFLPDGAPQVIFTTRESKIIKFDTKGNYNIISHKKLLQIHGIPYHLSDDFYSIRWLGSMLMNTRVWSKRPTFFIAEEKEGPYKASTPLPPNPHPQYPYGFNLI